MKPTFHLISTLRRPAPDRELKRRGLCSWATFAFAGLAIAATSPARAEVVSGRVQPPPTPSSPPARRGYVRTRVTDPSSRVGPSAPAYAVFLRVKESLPLEAPEPSVVALQGLALNPSVTACAVDGQLVLQNDDVQPVTFEVEGEPLEEVPPGGSVTYECTAGKTGEELRSIVVREWPGVRGQVYVGELGVAASVGDDGRFRVNAAKGTYELRVVGASGVVATEPVTVERRRVDVGTVKVGEGVDPR